MAELSDEKVKKKPPRQPNKWEIARTMLAVCQVLLTLLVLYFTVTKGM